MRIVKVETASDIGRSVADHDVSMAETVRSAAAFRFAMLPGQRAAGDPWVGSWSCRGPAVRSRILHHPDHSTSSARPYTHCFAITERGMKIFMAGATGCVGACMAGPHRTSPKPAAVGTSLQRAHASPRSN